MSACRAAIRRARDLGLANELIPSLEKGAWSTSKAPARLGGAGTHCQRGTHFGTHHPASFGIRMDQRESSTAAEKHKAPVVGASCSVVVGEEGLEQGKFPSGNRAIDPSVCAHLCADLEIPALVRVTGRIAEWDGLPEDLRRRIASLPPEVLAALSTLFGGLPQQ